MSNNTPTMEKKVSKIAFNREKQRFMNHVKVLTFYWNPIEQRRISRNPINTRYIWDELPESLVKTVTVPIILKKSMNNLETFETVSAFFEGKLRISVLSDEIYKYYYLSESKGKVFFHDLDRDLTYPFGMNGELAGIKREFLKGEKKLSTDEAVKLMDKGISVYEKIGEEVRVLI